jgi:hypothetical protein
MGAQRLTLIEALGNIASSINKSASDVSDGGPTTHPVKSLDNGTVPLKEGERSKENESDVKAQVGGDNIEVAPAQSQDSDTLSGVQSEGGLNAKPTGEDPSAEKDYKGNIKDPGTSMPADVSDNEKYSKATFEMNIKTAADLGNAILSAIVTPKTAAAKPAPVAPVAAVAPIQKDAAVSTEDIIRGTLEDACNQADLLGYHLMQYKQAEEELKEPPEGAEAPAGPGGPPPGGMPADPGAGALPPDAGMMGGGMPPAGMPPAGGDPGAGGAPPQDEALQQLVAGLAEMGITPEMLMQAAQATQPDPNGDMQAKQAFVASTALNFMRTGKYRMDSCKSARERDLRDKAKDYSRQIFGL